MSAGVGAPIRAGLSRPVVYDVTRLVTRALNPTPNGIDRVDFALARHFLTMGGEGSVALACAALAVVGYHMNVLPSGQAGVDVFFVISGFIMSEVAPREGRAFLRKRLIRIKASGADRVITFTGGTSKGFVNCAGSLLTVSGSNWTYTVLSGKTAEFGLIYDASAARHRIVGVVTD